MKAELLKHKILIVHNYYQIPGGEDTVVANEKKMLELNGHEVVLYSRNNSELKRMGKFRKLLLPFTTVFSIKTYKEVKKVIRQQNIELVHVHNTLNLISPSVYYAAFSCKVPVIQTIHNFRLLCPSATFYRDGVICEECVCKGLKSAIKYSCYRGSKIQTLACVITLKIHRLLGTYRRLNFICLTEFNKRKLLELNKGKKQIIDPDKVFVKPNFVNIDRRKI
nr:glycosyltransferase [Lysinibacillus timonensis]